MPQAAVAAGEAARRQVPMTVDVLMRNDFLHAGDLSKILGVTPTAVSARLRGETAMRQEELAALAAFFDVPVLTFYLPVDEAEAWVAANRPQRPTWMPPKHTPVAARSRKRRGQKSPAHGREGADSDANQHNPGPRVLAGQAA